MRRIDLGLAFAAALAFAACADDSDPPTDGDLVDAGGGASAPDSGAGATGGAGGTQAPGDGGVAVTGGAGGEPGEGGSGGSEAPSDVVVETEVWDDVPLSNRSGASDYLTIELPDDVISLTIIGLGHPGFQYVVERLEGPNGEIAVHPQPPGVTISDFQRQALGVWAGQFLSPNRASPAEEVTGLLLPNTPLMDVTPGGWKFKIAGASQSSGFGGPPIQVVALVKRAETRPVAGMLPMHFYFTGSNGWTAASAPDNAAFQQALARMAEFYAHIGIELVAQSFQDIDESYRRIDINIFGGGSSEQLNALYAESVHDDGVNLFFVDALGPAGSPIGGIAGGIPGPNLISGTARSGVVVNTSIDNNPLAIGHVMGHETGHYLGLFHTTELLLQGINDPIPDTPEGRTSASNLMFPTVTPMDASLTPGQGFVLLGNATIE